MWSQIKQSSLLFGSLVYIGTDILNALIPFALLPILTRYLLPEEYGQVAMFHILLSGLIGLVGLSVAGAAARKYYDDNSTEQVRRFIAACLQILCASSIAILLLLLVLGDTLSAWLGLQMRWVYWALFVASASVVVQLRLTQWQVRKRATQFGALQIGQSVVNFLLSLLLVIGLLQGAEGRIWAQIATAAIFALLALYFLRRDGLLGFWCWRPDYITEALRFGVPLIPHVAGGILLLYVDRIVINRELGLAAAGLYMVAFQISAAAMLVFAAINNAYVPWLFERLGRDDAGEKHQIVRYTYLWFVVILSGAALMFAIGPTLVSWVAGPSYAEAGDAIGWLVLGQVFGGMYLMVTNYIFYSKRTGALSVATLTAGITNVVLLFVLVRSQGIAGAAIAFASAMGLRFALTWAIAQKRHPMPWFPLRRAV